MPDKILSLEMPAEQRIIWEKPKPLTQDDAALVSACGEAMPGKPQGSTNASLCLKCSISVPVTGRRTVTEAPRVWGL